MIRYQELLFMENKVPPPSEPGTSTERSETPPRDSLGKTKKMEKLKENMVHGQENLNEGWMAAALLNSKSIITKFYPTFDDECSDDYREMDSSESSSYMTVLESLTAFPRGGHVSSLTPSLFPISHVHTLTEGLTNFGFNCYVNASLQCLFTAETFCGELSNLLDNSFPKVDNTLIRCFVELSRLRNSLKGGHEINKDSLLKDLILSATMINPEFTIDQQNDAHEFLCFCLSEIEEFSFRTRWKEDVKPRCPVKSNFKFNMRNIITCTSCGSQQNKLEVFNHLSVPLVCESVEECVYDIVYNTTVLERKCTVCGGESASSRWVYDTLPRFLIVQLNRFQFTDYYTVTKLHTAVDISRKLHIDCPPQPPQPDTQIPIEKSEAEGRKTALDEEVREIQTDRMKEDVRKKRKRVEKEDCGSNSTYRLRSVLSHIGGEAGKGHYVTDCSRDNHHQWMTCNDQFVTQTTEKAVLERRTNNAYVLLYERLNTV